MDEGIATVAKGWRAVMIGSQIRRSIIQISGSIVMNDANHQMNTVTTFPFYTLEGWEMNVLDPSEMPFKGDMDTLKLETLTMNYFSTDRCRSFERFVTDNKSTVGTVILDRRCGQKTTPFYVANFTST